MRRDLAGFGGVRAGQMSNVRPDGHKAGAEALLHVIDVVQHRVDVPAASQKTRDAADPDIAAAIGQRPNDLVRFRADVTVHRDTAGVAGHYRLAGDLGRFEAGLPACVGAVRNHANAIHLGDYRPAEVTQAGVGRLGAAVAYHVSPIVGQMHDPDSELEKDPDVAQLVFH